MDVEAAITGPVSPNKQVLAAMFDQGTAVVTVIAGTRQIKVSRQGRSWDEGEWEKILGNL